MKIQFFIALCVVSSINCQQSKVKCHYSCETCVGQSYTLCSKCTSGKDIIIVEDPKISQTKYINSNDVSGVCIGEVEPKANILGIILLLICTAIAIAVRTPYSIYLISTLQTLSLISFVQISWVTPVGYLLQSLQYFMIFNWFGSGYKIQDQTMRQRQFYRLDIYFHQSNFIRNFVIVGIFNLLLIIMIVILAIWKYKKEKKQKQVKVNQRDQQQKKSNLENDSQIMGSENLSTQNKQISLSQKILITTLKVCLTAFYFMIQESSLVIMVGLRFQSSISTTTKAISIVYCIFLLCFLTYLFIEKLWFFPNKQSQYVNVWKKIAVPVFTIVPYSITYLIVIFLFIFIIAQSFFDYQSGGYKFFSRITFYKLIEFFIIVLAGAYIITELNVNLQVQTNIIRVFLSIAILAFFAVFFVELFFGIIDTYFANKNQIKNQSQLQSKRTKRLIFNTQETINQMNNQTADKDPNRMKVVIEDLQNENNQLDNRDKQGSNDLTQQSQQRRKKQEQQLARKRKQEQQARMKKQQEELDKKNKEQEQRRLKQEERRRKEQQQRKRIQQQKRKRQLQQKKRRQEQQRKRRQEEQRRKREQQQELQRKRKKKQEQQQKKREEQQARRRKQEQQAKRRKQQEERRRKQFEQEQERRRKKQQEEQQQAKQRRRRKYMSQMDPQLRKRYGF